MPVIKIILIAINELLLSLAFDDKIGTEQLTTKWQSLRNQYRTTLQNSMKKKSGEGVSKPPNWKYFTQMAFVGETEKEQTVQSESDLSFEENEASQTMEVESQATRSGSDGVAKRKRQTVSTNSAEDVERKKEMDELMRSGMKVAIDRLQQAKQPPDDAQVFGNYLISELRKIKNVNYRESTQRRLLQLLWDAIEKEPVYKFKIIMKIKNPIDTGSKFRRIPVSFR